MSRVVLITGCSSGVGKSLALQLSKLGKYKVYATMRNPKPISDDKNENLIISKLDVNSDESVANFMKDINKVDILVNNAGFAINGTHESNSMEQVKQQFETNFFGVIRLHRYVLPLMRKQKSGHIIGISSLGGLLGVPFNDVYCASKYALEGLYESMASTNLQFNIHTSLIEPGAILTDFTSNAKVPEVSDLPEDLQETFTSYRKAMLAAFSNNSAQTPDQVAEVIIKAINDGENGSASLRYQTSEAGNIAAKMKLADTTGDSLVKGSTARFFGNKQ